MARLHPVMPEGRTGLNLLVLIVFSQISFKVCIALFAHHKDRYMYIWLKIYSQICFLLAYTNTNDKYFLLYNSIHTFQECLYVV